MYIANISIFVKEYLSTMLNLILVEWPGITGTSILGRGKPENEEITKNMNRHFLKKAKTIILANVPANVDLSISKALISKGNSYYRKNQFRCLNKNIYFG